MAVLRAHKGFELHDPGQVGFLGTVGKVFVPH
jgi:hypothetical protein